MPPLFPSVEALACDLDGTLIDTAPDLGAAANRVLTELGLPELPSDSIRGLIGAGIDEFVTRALKRSLGGAAPEAQLRARALALVRKAYGERLFHLSRLFPGVREALQQLLRLGRPLACITNKESRFTVPLLEAAGLGGLFALTLCADAEQDRKPRPNLLHLACSELGVVPAQLLYVGDSPADVAAARAAGCPVLVVDYGYHRAESLLELRADGVVSHFSEIVTLFARRRS